MRDELSVLSAFLAVADERSFTRAAKRWTCPRQGSVRRFGGWRNRWGPALTRTTRSVSPTDAGEQLLAQLRPALSDIRGVLTTLSGLQSTPVGRIRLLSAARRKTVVGPKLGQFVRDTRVSSSRSRPTTAVSIRVAGYDAAFSSGNTSRRTWWPFASRRTSGPLSSRTRLLRLTPQPTSPRTY